MVQRIGARENITDHGNTHTGKMQQAPQKKRNTKNIRRNNEEQYRDYDHHCVVHKTIPQPKLQTVPKDYRITQLQDLEEDFDRVLYTNPGLKRRPNPSPVRRENVKKIFSDPQRIAQQQWRHTKYDFTTDSDSQENQTSTRYGTFLRYRAAAEKIRHQPPKDREPSPHRYQAYRKTYKFIITTDEPTNLVGDATLKTHARIPEGTTITADSHQRGRRGERTYQTDKATQTTNPWLSTFERNFGNLSM
jgi:hypothetical protein